MTYVSPYEGIHHATDINKISQKGNKCIGTNSDKIIHETMKNITDIIQCNVLNFLLLICSNMILKFKNKTLPKKFKTETAVHLISSGGILPLQKHAPTVVGNARSAHH